MDPFSFLPYPGLKMVTFLRGCKLLQKARAGQPDILEIRWWHLKEIAISTSLTHMWEQQYPCFISSWILIARIRANSQNIKGFFLLPCTVPFIASSVWSRWLVSNVSRRMLSDLLMIVSIYYTIKNVHMYPSWFTASQSMLKRWHMGVGFFAFFKIRSMTLRFVI